MRLQSICFGGGVEGGGGCSGSCVYGGVVASVGGWHWRSRCVGVANGRLW